MNISAAIATLREAAQGPDTDLWDLMMECNKIIGVCAEKLKEEECSED